MPVFPSFIVPYSVSPCSAITTTSLSHSVDVLTSHSDSIHMSSFHLSSAQPSLLVLTARTSYVDCFVLVSCKRFHPWALYWKRASYWIHHSDILSSTLLNAFSDSNGEQTEPYNTRVLGDAWGYGRISRRTWRLPRTFLACKEPIKCK